MEYPEAHVAMEVHGRAWLSHWSESIIPTLSPAELWLVHFLQLEVGWKQMALTMKLMRMQQILLPRAAGQLKQHWTLNEKQVEENRTETSDRYV